MLKKITQLSLCLLLLSSATLLKAESAGYDTLSPAQPTEHTDKIEVIELVKVELLFPS